MSWIALLRGVNVGGINIKSVDLAEVFSNLGYKNVKTVLASGNVLFDADASARETLSVQIENALSERFSYTARIVLVTQEKLSSVVANFPFVAELSGWHPYVLFTKNPAVLAELMMYQNDLRPEDEIISLGEQVIYWHCRRAVGINSQFSKLLVKTKFANVTTNRNLRTLKKLLG